MRAAQYSGTILSMKRREFIKTSAMGSASLALGVAACGQVETEPPDATVSADAPQSQVDASVPDAAASSPDASLDAGLDASTCAVRNASGESAIHSHVLVIPQADIESAQDTTYTSLGGSHAHGVLITAAQFTELATACTVTVTSTDTHSHVWTILMDEDL